MGKHRKFLPSQCGGQPWDSVGSLPSVWSSCKVFRMLYSSVYRLQSIISYNWPSEVTSRQQVWSSQSHSPAHHPCREGPPPHCYPEGTQTQGDQATGQHTSTITLPHPPKPHWTGTKLMSRALKGLKPLCMTPAEKASGQKKWVSKAFSDMPQSTLCVRGVFRPFPISPFSPQPLVPKTDLFLLFFLKQKFYPLHPLYSKCLSFWCDLLPHLLQVYTQIPASNGGLPDCCPWPTLLLCSASQAPKQTSLQDTRGYTHMLLLFVFPQAVNSRMAGA